MGITPNSRIGKVQFYEAHIQPWTTNAAAIGLTPADVAALASATGAARVAFNGMIAARDAAKAATQNFYDKVSVMHSDPGKGSDMIDAIKNFAQSTDNPSVYTLAQIPPPASGGVVPPPGIPYAFRVALQQSGAIELRWKADNPSGAGSTVYEVLRSVGGGAFEFVETAGEKKFTDETIPGNAGPVTYRVTGVRGASRGPLAEFTVKLGFNGQTESGEGGLSLAA